MRASTVLVSSRPWAGEVADELLRGETGLLLVADRGFDGAAMRGRLTANHHGLLLTPARKLRRYHPSPLIQGFARHRNCCERPFAVLQHRFAIHRHRGCTLWGLVTRLATTLVAFALRTLWRSQGNDVE
jgi:hypothetical protein